MTRHNSSRQLTGALVRVCLFLIFLLPLSLPLVLRPAPASAGSCAEDAANRLQNGTMAPGASGPYGVVADKWSAFVLSANVPVFENAGNEGWDPNGSQYIWRDLGAWDAGIYQRVTTLTPGQTYHFWIVWGQALHDMGGDNARATQLNRQIGVDLTGGTNPNSPSVIWTVPYYGTSGFNRLEWNLYFNATGSTATFFLRAQNFHTDGRNKVFFDTACLYPSSGSPTTTPWASVTPSPTTDPNVTRIDDADPAIFYNARWKQDYDPLALNGTYHYGRGAKGAAVVARHTFNGTQVTLRYIGWVNRGKARVFIDGVRIATLDMYRPTLEYNLAETFSGLAPGTHTIKIKNAGAKNPASKDSILVIDAFEVPTTTGGLPHARPNAMPIFGATPTPFGTRRAPTRTPTDTPAPRRLIPFQSAPVAAPTPDDPSVIWDPRLPDLNVSLEPAAVSPGTRYWKLVRADYHDPFQHTGDFGGDHNMYFVVTDEYDAPVVGQRVWQGWPDDSTSALTDARGIADIPMWANYFPANGPGPYRGWVDGLPSDTVSGMGLPANNHVSFVLYFKRTVAGAGASPTATSTPTDTPAPPTSTPTRTPSSPPPTPTKTRTPTATAIVPPTATATNPPPTSEACALGVLTTIPVGGAPKGIAVDPATNRVFVGLADSSAVAVIDAATMQVIATWQTDGVGNSNGVALAQGKVFVTKRNSASVSVLNAANGAFLGSIAVGSAPYGIAASGNRVWVANFDSGTVTLIDADTLAVLKTTTVNPHPALAAASSGSAFVSTWDAGVSRLDSNNAVVASVPLGSGTFGVAVNSAGGRVYATNRNTQMVHKLNASGNAPELSQGEPFAPYAIAANPTTDHLFILNAEANKVRVRNGADLALLGNVTVGAQGDDGGDTLAAVNDRIFVGNYADGTVSIVQDCADLVPIVKPTRTPTPPLPTDAPTPTPLAACTRVPVILYPAQEQHITSRTPQLDWKNVKCATSYGLQFSKASVDNLLIDTTTAVSAYKVPRQARNNAYFFRVRSCNAAGCSAWSEWSSFYIDPK